MDKFKFSTKHVAINKANAQMVAVVGVASFITIFCLVAAKAVYSQYQYQSRVISAASTAHNQLLSNISAYKNLVYSYGKFDAANPNILGGTVTGSTNDNAHVILDALPGEYDFPGLISTIEGILDGAGIQVQIPSPLICLLVSGFKTRAIVPHSNLYRLCNNPFVPFPLIL
jgi:hypothetical protein